MWVMGTGEGVGWVRCRYWAPGRGWVRCRYWAPGRVWGGFNVGTGHRGGGGAESGITTKESLWEGDAPRNAEAFDEVRYFHLSETPASTQFWNRTT